MVRDCSTKHFSTWKFHERQLSDQNEAEINIESTAADFTELRDELAHVFEKMKTHGSASFPQLLFIANAVNGTLAMAWYNADTGQLDETRVYFLRLKKIFNDSLDHKDGAFYYDKECRVAICCFMEDAIYDEEGNESCQVYFKTDMTALEQLII